MNTSVRLAVPGILSAFLQHPVTRASIRFHSLVLYYYALLLYREYKILGNIFGPPLENRTYMIKNKHELENLIEHEPSDDYVGLNDCDGLVM